ncbi:hypothetical protein XENTR_v10023396 [Xenopus tropicalis]|nr:hypothetical protein XENTR_v10023396 [Xenopus tropicalis]
MEPVAKVSLKIQRAQGLPGEFLSAADGYAIFMYDGKEVRTQSGSITTPFGIDVPKSQRVSDTGAEEPSGALSQEPLLYIRVIYCTHSLTPSALVQCLVLYISFLQDSSCCNLKATAAEKEGRRTLEKRAQEEEEEYARQRNLRMRLQERIKESLHEESLEEAERFAIQQKQRFIDNERFRIREEEAQEKAEKVL